jgi:nitrite reductase/ring-hydroxylating ferredoxin subunit
MIVESTRWHAIPDGRVNALPEGASLRVMVKGRAIRFVRSGGRLHAVIDRCPHQEKSFEGGWCEGGHLVCPWHRFSFDLATGRSVGGSTPNLEVFALEQRSGGLYIGFPHTTVRVFGIDLW